MEEGGRGGSLGVSSSSSALLSGGGRQRFEVELRPGETTIVSWKKLMKDSNKAAINDHIPPVPAPSMPTTVAVNKGLNPLNAPPGVSVEKEANDAAHGSRFGAVIEKIERLYMGKNSSDEEDINDIVPDDDEYDTGDSFIDDTELDEYFQVDNSQIKHDGFFVNRGKLERTTLSQNEATALPNHQQKKRRKDSEKVNGGQTNNLKVNDKATWKVVTSLDKSKASSTVNSGDIKDQNPVTVLEKDNGSQLKNGSPLQRSNDKSSNVQSRSKELKNQSVMMREKNVIHEQLVSKQKNALMAKKEGSSTKSKSLLLEKAIRDLEKIVVESRPPTMGVNDADTSSSPAVKKRMPPEIKHMLAKVARLDHAIHGKISKELLNRLMSIVGHLIQLRTLRRNLVNMVNMGLSAKEEKDAKILQLKRQIDEMVKIRAPMMISKAMEGESDDFQESGTKEKESIKRRITMDGALEDKICNLYDLFVEGLDEDAGPQVRKLYAELAKMWPEGFMDNHGIRGAICRAKDRRKALINKKGQEKLKRKKTLPTNVLAVTSEVANMPKQKKLKCDNQSGKMTTGS